jgi:hypothetical protein
VLKLRVGPRGIEPRTHGLVSREVQVCEFACASEVSTMVGLCWSWLIEVRVAAYLADSASSFKVAGRARARGWRGQLLVYSLIVIVEHD